LNAFTTATDSLTLWNELKTRAGLDLRKRNDAPHGYDVPLEDRLNALLFPERAESLDRNLRTAPRTPEQFLSAFFQAQRPFSMMVRDVLELFETANAQYGTHNLKIVFNFEKARQLALNLEQFREWDRFLQRVVQKRSVWQWTPNALWQLTRAFEKFLEYESPAGMRAPRDSAVSRWVDLRDSPDWHDHPPFPRSGNEGFDHAIGRCERLLDAYRVECRALAPDRTTFLEIGAESYAGLRSPVPETAAEASRIYNLYQPETDFWASTFLHRAAVASEEVADGKKTVSPEFLVEFNSRLDSIDQGTKLVEEWQELLRELLSLPIWQRRHELYAVWVGSRIVAALDDVEAIFHVEAGVLEFPFSGAHLATFTTPHPAAFMFWTELRTPLAEKSESGRKSIQPDYRIVRLPYAPVTNTVLVVECKQYRRSSRREFSHALNDYAAGCPNAHVALVNNGPIGASVYTSVAPEYSGRTNAIADFRPDCQASERRFRALVREVILGDPSDSPEIDVEKASAPTAIILTWGAGLSDLDLIVICRSLEGGGPPYTVSYQNHGTLEGWPWLLLDRDVQVGPGEEIIRAAQWVNAIYDIYVHNYSDDRSPACEDVSVTVHHPRKGSPQRIEGPAFTGGRGRYWHVCSIDGVTGLVDIIGTSTDHLSNGRRARP
jgi:hypothetical protein